MFVSGLLLVQVDEIDESLCAAFNAETAVECGMIVFGLSPVALGVEVVIGCAVAVGHLDVGFCFGLAALFTFHDAADALRQWGVDEKVQAVGVLAQDVVGAAAYDDARPGVGHLADDLALRKEHLVRQRHGLRQETVVLVAQYARHTVFQIFNDLGGESRNGSRELGHVFVVKRNVVVFGECLSYFAAARPILAADGDDLFHGRLVYVG